MKTTAKVLAAVMGAALGAVMAASAAWAQGDELAHRGEYLARAGNCVACHSLPGGAAFAGGLKMATPLGAIYATNITPDAETGIGGYTLADFDAAVRKGVAKQGHRLYPAMPYPSYAKLTEADIEALYAYFMKVVPPVKQANKPSEIPAPFNMRWPLAIWNVLFVDFDRYQDAAGKDAAWNRGAYLIQGLGHCGACHTPRGLFWQEKALDDSDADYLAGAELDYWSAANLRQDVNAGLGRWTQEDLVTYFKTGHSRFGNAFGTMTEVINNSTQYLTDADIAAMATYLRSLPAKNPGETAYAYNASTGADLRERRHGAPGALTYVQQCEHCHVDDGKGYGTYLPGLAGSSTVLDANPVSLINITLNGSARVVVKGMPDAYRMPAFRDSLSDAQIADVVNFIRTGWGNKPVGNAAPVTAAAVAKVRAATNPASDRVEILKMK
ncbi:MAG: cytochrome c [Rhodospirillaceae bacterium]|nr:cytochrome c [Rhodospirillaceae bacterium]